MSNLPMEPLIRNAWYVAAWSAELVDGPVSRKIMGEDVVIFRSGDGDVGAVEDRCSHRAAKLSLGCPVRHGLMCATMAWCSTRTANVSRTRAAK